MSFVPPIFQKSFFCPFAKSLPLIVESLKVSTESTNQKTEPYLSKWPVFCIQSPYKLQKHVYTGKNNFLKVDIFEVKVSISWQPQIEKWMSDSESGQEMRKINFSKSLTKKYRTAFNDNSAKIYIIFASSKNATVFLQISTRMLTRISLLSKNATSYANLK